MKDESGQIQGRKEALRREVLARRDGLSEAARAEASRQLCDELFAWLVKNGPAVVSGFWPIRSEVDLRPLMAALPCEGFRLALPRIDDGRLSFRAWTGDPGDLVSGGFGTQVPAADAAIVAPEIALVPLLAFDAGGGRIGYGKGYYDTALAALSAAGAFTSIGVAFEIQRVENVPREAHDWLLDWLGTESGLRRAEPVAASSPTAR